MLMPTSTPLSLAGTTMVQGRTSAVHDHSTSTAATHASQFFEIIKRGDERAACRMLKAGFDVAQLSAAGASALGTAIEHEERGLVRLLLKAGADPDMVDTEGDATPAMIATEIGDESAIGLLKTFGADMDFPAGVSGRTAMFSALVNHSFDAVRPPPVTAQHS